MNRKAHWERIYSEKSPLEVSWYQQAPTLSLALIQATGAARDGAIIDVGGGASVLVDHLLGHGYETVSVLDLSATALAHARARLGERAARVTWIESDVTRFTPMTRYHVWHDRAVFHFLTEATDRDNYLAALKAALRPGGHAIIAAFAIGGPTQCSGLDIVQYDADKLSAVLGADFALVEQREETHLTPANREQKFGYFRYQRIA